MNIRPSDEFLAACRFVLGDASPATVISVLRTTDRALSLDKGHLQAKANYESGAKYRMKRSISDARICIDDGARFSGGREYQRIHCQNSPSVSPPRHRCGINENPARPSQPNGVRNFRAASHHLHSPHHKA